MKTPDAILTSDWHLREKNPLCRTDDYWKAMWGKVRFIKKLAEKYKCTIMHGGDLFDKAKSSPYLLSESLRNLPLIIMIPGQHDIPNHNMELLYKSNLAVINEVDKIDMIAGRKNKYEFPFFGKINSPDGMLKTKNKLKIAIVHTLVHETENPVKIMGGISAKSLMKKLSNYDLVLSGDNHTPFVVKQGNQLLVNPGSMMRMTAAQVDHKPRVYLWYADTNTVEPIYLPIEQDVIDRSHIEKGKDRDEKIEAFVDRLKDDVEIGINFEENLKKYFRLNRTRTAIENIVWEAL